MPHAAPDRRYRCGGLLIGSDIFLPELDPAPGGAARPALRIHRTHFPAHTFDRCRRPILDHFYESGPDCVRLRWPDEVDIEIRSGRDIAYEASPAMDRRSLRLCLLGPALATAWIQRGRAVVHAAALRDKRGAFAFVGGAGAGKSTLAAALADRGYELLTDNVLAMRPGRSVRVERMHRQIKLSPDVFRRMGLRAAGHPMVEPGNRKRSRMTAASRAPRSSTLHRIYFLERGRRVRIGAMSRRQALLEMARHPCGIGAGDSTLGREHFQRLMRCAQRMEFRRLTRTDRLSDLEALVSLVEADRGR